jgi:DNA helicase-2/ATP-dependent DNA helicase PcrA
MAVAAFSILNLTPRGWSSGFRPNGAAIARMKMELESIHDPSLNDQQRAAVSQIEGPILILAGPGSGKTRVITQRIAHLIANDISSYNIAALTFTNKAAGEMKKRLEKTAPGNQAWTGTFHRFCSRLLRRYASMVGLAENFSILDSDDSKRLLKQAIANSHTDLKQLTPDRVATEISRVKNGAITYEQFQPRGGHYFDAIISRIYPEYQKLLRLSNAVDFDDLLLHVVDLLRNSPEIREALDQHYAYMLVDEYQDTNTAQYEIIRLLNQDLQNLTATGDPDQSIYGWRGANINNILYFERDYPQVSVYRLEQNYRSTQSILAVADQLISNNVRRKKKTLFTENEAGDPVRLVTYPNPEEEASDIVSMIALALRTQQRRPSEFAILYRTNYLSRVLEHAFRRRRIPYQILRGFEFYQRKEVKDLLGYLHLINNPSDGVAFARVINVPPRKIGNVTLKRLQEYAVANGISVMDAARQCESVVEIAAAARSKIRKFVAMIDRLNRFADADVPTIMHQVLTETGYREWLTELGDEEGDERASNIDELINAAVEFERDQADEGGLERYLEQAALVSDTDAFDSEAEYVTLMSLHAAKGLEFPSVFIIGLEEGILPHERNNVDEEKVEEERRLLFVGITRAKSDLQLSRCSNRFRRGAYWPSIPSRFLMELPRREMHVIKPPSSAHGVDDEFDGVFDGMDPFMNDGLPSYDINADNSDGENCEEEVSSFCNSEIEIVPDDEADFDHSQFDDDQVKEPVVDYEVPQTKRRIRPASAMTDSARPASRKTKKSPSGSPPTFPRLMTAAQLEEQQAETEQVRIHPSRFQTGMIVEHPEYGIGTIINLTGEGKKRMATIEFAALGKKRFHLAFTNLRVPELE